MPPEIHGVIEAISAVLIAVLGGVTYKGRKESKSGAAFNEELAVTIRTLSDAILVMEKDVMHMKESRVSQVDFALVRATCERIEKELERRKEPRG